MQNREEAVGKIIAVCTAPEKGMIKHDVGEGLLIEGIGIKGDAHAGFMHRQVSLISIEDIRTMMEKLPDLVPGSFAENLTTEGFDLSQLKIGDRLKVGETVLEVSQIGKECHQVRGLQKTGDCMIPQKDVNTKVIKGGRVKQEISYGSTIKSLYMKIRQQGKTNACCLFYKSNIPEEIK